MVDRSTSEDVRFRFGLSFNHLPPAWAQRLSQIDYDREMALVAETADGAILGVARLAADPEGETAEFALMVRSDWRDHGLGRRLLQALLDYAVTRGLRRVWGDVASDNGRMLDLCEAFGFGREPGGDPTRSKVIKALV